jgi:hypothetical protein
LPLAAPILLEFEWPPGGPLEAKGM